MTRAVFEPLAGHRSYPDDEMRERAAAFHDALRRRRTVREFSDKPVPRAVVEDAIRCAGSAPSGANLQPWHFAVITDPAVKRRIRAEAEAEERAFYDGRAPQEWLDALAPLGTDANKPFLETAPVLIAIFMQRHGKLPDGRLVKHYYVPESVGIATGFLIAALHDAGLVTLTHTPSPMGFLNEICRRPDNEKPAILLVVGHPAADAKTPIAARLKKPLDEIASWI
ncbi:MAG: nitroreductase family protein [Alphaproteobacteria bacterium]|nr:nitroreductase family protein [Alphaproteobacteria bacterium]